MFVPVFTLRTDDITDDKPVQAIHQDVILPEAQAAINQREGRNYKNSVEIMQPVPPATPEDQGDENAIYGMAMFRGVDRETDFFTVYMAGFSNGYRYVDGPVKFAKLKEMATSGELKPSDAVWNGAEEIRTASEICNWKASIKAQIELPREWQSAGSVPGLCDDLKTPPADAAGSVLVFHEDGGPVSGKQASPGVAADDRAALFPVWGPLRGIGKRVSLLPGTGVGLLAER